MFSNDECCFKLGEETNRAELFAPYTPRSCCSYPIYSLTNEQHANCLEKTKEKDQNCFLECQMEALEIFVNGEVNLSNVMKAFEVDFKNETISEEKWRPVIESSIESCQKLGKKLL